MRDPRKILGLLLIAGGLLWALAATTDVDAVVVVPGVGLAFIVAYLATRAYGLLIPGGILTGLGAGLIVASQGGPSQAATVGVGLGFVAITVIDRLSGEVDTARWPLIPGGILTFLGAAEIAGIRDIGMYVVPALLILIGVVVLLRPSRDRSDADHAPATAPPARGTDRPADSDTGDERR